ncbi:hypothetical protein [Virgibacillus subterraneus]|nr:hypothetical protein [Virgibacillus subterraneus]
MPTSRLRNKTIHGLLKLCRDKEAEGYVCVKPIQKKQQYFKQFNQRRGRLNYQSTEEESYYEAIYRKERLD